MRTFRPSSSPPTTSPPRVKSASVRESSPTCASRSMTAFCSPHSLASSVLRLDDRSAAGASRRQPPSAGLDRTHFRGAFVDRYYRLFALALGANGSAPQQQIDQRHEDEGQHARNQY